MYGFMKNWGIYVVVTVIVLGAAFTLLDYSFNHMFDGVVETVEDTIPEPTDVGGLFD